MVFVGIKCLIDQNCEVMIRRNTEGWVALAYFAVTYQRNHAQPFTIGTYIMYILQNLGARTSDKNLFLPSSLRKNIKYLEEYNICTSHILNLYINPGVVPGFSIESEWRDRSWWKLYNFNLTARNYQYQCLALTQMNVLSKWDEQRRGEEGAGCRSSANGDDAEMIFLFSTRKY